MPYCAKCGQEVEEGAKFCQKCGAPLSGQTPLSTTKQNNSSGNTCPQCGSIIPFGNIVCTKCGNQLNQEEHKTAMVLGYICSILLPLGGIIFGIYLLTRPNKEVHKHGIIMIMLSIVILIIFWLISSYLAYQSSYNYYNNYYDDYGYNGYDSYYSY